MIYIINRDNDNGIKLTWLIIIALVPVFGVCLYLFVKADYPSKKIASRMKTLRDKTFRYNRDDTFHLEQLKNNNDDESGIFQYLYSSGYSPVYKNTYSEYISLGDNVFPIMLEEIKKATSFIFIEYFIIDENSQMFKKLLKTLREKIHEGVDVRIIYDGMGSLFHTSANFPEKLKKYGIKCRIFAPVKPFLSTYQNNRDHRKILVIDGKTAFSGGINISDEYINQKMMYGHWKDNSILLKGDAVKSFTVMFLRMWDVIGETESDYAKYVYERNHEYCTVDDGYVAPFYDDPMTENRIAKSLYISMINSAKKYVHIMTPYLVLDEEMRNAMKFAAKRNVDVKIIMPHIPDKWYAFALARTYYPELIKSGVKIYEYTPGFVHSKTIVCDDIRAVVGTCNFDYRSLFLHYECGVYLYTCKSVYGIENDFKNTLEHSKLFKLDDFYATSFFMRIVGRILRAFAPLM